MKNGEPYSAMIILYEFQIKIQGFTKIGSLFTFASINPLAVVI